MLNNPAIENHSSPLENADVPVAAKFKKKEGGISVSPYFVPAEVDPYQQVPWSKRSSQIMSSDGQPVFERRDIEAPESWSQLAVDIVVSKYFKQAGVPNTGSEVSVRQLVHRIAHTISEAGDQLGYFRSIKDTKQFEKELVHLLLNQKGSFNSPVWFNCGLFQEYGIQGTGGQWVWNPSENKIVPTRNAYENPQSSACFIQGVEDDLMSIFDLVKNEARIFRFGSGSGSNFSRVRGKTEKLSGGGTSSGLMSFLEVLDRSAGATKSGGTTRRAAKMVCLDLDHPEIEDFITWKSREEKKVLALVEAGYSNDFNGEAYRTVSGQNSNNSVRIPDEFMKAVLEDGDWLTKARTDGHIVSTLKARDLWKKIARAAWDCADPGVQFDSTIQKWHTCPESGRINSSNPCSEYMFIDDSACNLSSLNLVKFLKQDGTIDLPAMKSAIRIFLIAQDILVDFSSYPTEKIALNSHRFRPLGLGYANLGTLLMMKGIPYDSDEGRSWAGGITAFMHGEACLVSSELSKTKGAFEGFLQNAEPMMQVMKKHRSAVDELAKEFLPEEMFQSIEKVWDDVLIQGKRNGFRNAQMTVLAPTGTIGLLMDCDTTGIEPDFALVKFKKLAGGGYFKIVNQSVPKALMQLGYSDSEISRIIQYAVGTLNLVSTPFINREILQKHGFTGADIDRIEAALPSAYDLNSAVSNRILTNETLQRLGLAEGNQSILERIGFTKTEIQAASEVACGRLTLEGAPDLKLEHLPIFDCASKCGSKGVRFLSGHSHLKMMAAVQPFLSGAISKTVNLPNEASVEDIAQIYEMAWRLGLKAVAVYRDGSKVSQVLSSSGTKDQKPVMKASDTETELPRKKRKLPQKRRGLTVASRVAGHQVFVRTGEYEDGTIGEIFIDVHKEGATLRSLLNCFAISVSMGLQYGAPLEDYVEKFTFTKFEPQGLVDHPNIKTATSLIDYIFRVLGMEYLGRVDFVHVKPNPKDLAIAMKQPGLKERQTASPANTEDPLNLQLSAMQGDAPMCNTCGHVTIRNGSCYRCLNCGNSLGCS